MKLAVARRGVTQPCPAFLWEMLPLPKIQVFWPVGKMKSSLTLLLLICLSIPHFFKEGSRQIVAFRPNYLKSKSREQLQSNRVP